MRLGSTRWAIADGYIPTWSNGPSREMVSHEAICILNASPEPAELRLTVYFSDRDPVGPYILEVPPRRTLHARFNEFDDPAPIPSGVDFAVTLDATVPVVVQHTRLDSRQTENGLFSTIAYPAT